MAKVIITCAMTGNITIPAMTPYLPITPEAIAEQAAQAVEAGAASIHIHPRDPQNGKPTPDVGLFRDIATRIKKKTGNAIVCTTTGGTAEMTPEQRSRVVPELKPELATFNMGSLNFAVHQAAKRLKDEDYKYPWEKEFILSTKKFVFTNTFADIERLCGIFAENNTKPELELYDMGHIYNVAYFIREGILKPPLWIQFVTGILGGIASYTEDIVHMKETADRVLGPENYKWSMIATGYPREFWANAVAMTMGGNVRVGFEDNIFVEKGVLAKSNADLVAKVVRIARELGHEPATPDEAREILGLKGNDKVNF